MTKHHPALRMISVGLVLLTLVASLVVTTRMVSVSHPANPATLVPLTQYGQFPVSTVGRLTILFPKLLKSSIVQYCTGTLLVSANGSVVDTAAHCFFDPKTGKLAKATNIQFCPQYHGGASPLGCWTGKKLFVSPAYSWSSNFTLFTQAVNDYAFLVVSPLSGKTLQSVVGQGAQIKLFSYTNAQPISVYGYPTGPSYSGTELYSIIGQITLDDGYFGKTLVVPGLLGPGASGGPCFLTIAGTPYITGHVAVGDERDGKIFSPLLGTDAWTALFTQAGRA